MVTLNTALIIAGGKGTRLSEYTKEIPKPMIPVAGKPVLEWMVENLADQGVVRVFITVGYLKDAIIQYFGDGRKYGVSINYIVENEPLGTAGALAYLRGKIETPFFVAYGDLIFNINLERFYEAHIKGGAPITLLAHPNSHPYDSNLVECNNEGRAVKIYKKDDDRPERYWNLTNAGAYIFDPCVLEAIDKPSKIDLENDIVDSFIRENQVAVYRTPEYVKDMGTPDRMQGVEQQIRCGIVNSMSLLSPQKCVFLDRDGTINKNVGLLSDLEAFDLEEHAAQGIKLLNDHGYLCIVITNQPVIARNLCTIEELNEIFKKMETLLGNKGAYVTDVFYCPHHPDSGYPEERKEYKIDCDCRKPGIGLIEQAAKRYPIDFSRSYMVGDTTTDLQTGKNAGLRTILLQTGEGGKDGKYDVKPYTVCQNLLKAAEFIVMESGNDHDGL